MQATEMAVTNAFAPYDALRPMRCRNEIDGRKCTGRGGDIDWAAPDTHAFRCPKCKAFNLVHVVEAAHG